MYYYVLWRQQKLTLLLLNTCPVLANSVDPDQLATEEANWSGSALFVIKYVNFYQKPGSSNLIGLKFEIGAVSLFRMTRVKTKCLLQGDNVSRNITLAVTWENVPMNMYAQRRIGSACVCICAIWPVFAEISMHYANVCSNILKISPPKIESFPIKILVVFIFLLKT